MNIPAGYKLVPIEPTEAMIEAAYVYREECRKSRNGILQSSKLYKAMIDAAPEQKCQEL